MTSGSAAPGVTLGRFATRSAYCSWMLRVGEPGGGAWMFTRSVRSSLAQAFVYFGAAQREEIEHREKVEEIIELLEIESIRHQPVGSLGYGLRKRVDLGRALAQDPKILLMDEPMAGMNSEEKEDMARFILDVREEWGVTVLMVEQNVKSALKMADEAIALESGRLVLHKSADDLLNDPNIERLFLGGAHAAAAPTTATPA